MADLRDEKGNPIQLTDQFGKPVELTDEFGNPMHLKGVATTAATAQTVDVAAAGPQEQLRRSGSSSSSSSSEDDGQGGRRKKKGLNEKIKETVGVGKHKESKDEAAHSAPINTTTSESQTSASPPAPASGQHEKGLMGKIKDKLSGHHHSST